MWTRRIFLAILLLAWGTFCVASRQYDAPLWQAIANAFRSASSIPKQRPPHYPPNHAFHDISVGDLARNAYLRRFQSQRPVEFTTDARGFRINGQARTDNAQVVLIGDSYGAGAEARDEDTVAGRLSALLQVPVYNQSFPIRPRMETLDNFLKDKAWLNSKLRVVVFVRVLHMVIKEANALPFRPEAVSRKPSIPQILKRVKSQLESSNKLRKWLREQYADLKFRVTHSHPYLRHYKGQDILVWPPANQKILGHRRGAPQAYVRELKNFADKLKDRGISFVFVPVPEAFTIYPELLTNNETKRLKKPSFLNDMMDACSSQKVNCINVVPQFRANRDPYLYLNNDQHWTSRAMRLTAETIAPFVERLLARPRKPKLPSKNPTHKPVQ